MEKRYFLNKSNSKWISIGVKPATKIVVSDSVGFFVEILIDGKNTIPFVVGGTDGLLSLCKALRKHDHLKFAHPGSASEYSDLLAEVPFNIMVKPINGSILFGIENTNGESVQLMMTSLFELLKVEKYVVTVAKLMREVAEEAEQKFNDFIRKTTSSSIDEAIGNDLMLIEIFANFNELYTMCINVSAPPSTGLTLSVPAPSGVPVATPSTSSAMPLAIASTSSAIASTSSAIAPTVNSPQKTTTRKRRAPAVKKDNPKKPALNSALIDEITKHVAKFFGSKLMPQVEQPNQTDLTTNAANNSVDEPKVDSDVAVTPPNNDHTYVAQKTVVQEKIKKLPPIATIKPNTATNKSKILTPQIIESDSDDTSSSDGEHFELNSQVITEQDLDEALGFIN